MLQSLGLSAVLSTCMCYTIHIVPSHCFEAINVLIFNACQF